MHAKRGMAIPMAVLAVAGGIALGGCGRSSGDDTTTHGSQNASATTGSDNSMKHHEGAAMKDEHNAAMKDEHGAMKGSDEAMRGHDDSMQHDDAMKGEG